MSVEFRFRKPVMILYTEFHPKKSEDELDEVELKVKKVSTFEEAAYLEHELLWRWVERIQSGGYSSPPWTPTHGSPTMQLLAYLFELTGHAAGLVPAPAEEIKTEHSEIDIPEKITPEWLVNTLGNALSLPIEQVDTSDKHWWKASPVWYTRAVRELTEIFGGSTDKYKIGVFISDAKKVKDEQVKDGATAIGVLSTTDDFADRYHVFFKMKGADDVVGESEE